MRCGICLCGLNGCGKTTLAKALAETLGFKHLDIENYYFSTDDNSYSSPRTREEVETLLQNDIKENPCFVFSVVNPDISTEINNSYDVIIYLSAPTEVRMERLRTRSFEKFGNRILPGGDMYEKEMDFLNRAAVKDSARTEAWIKEQPCVRIHLDATKPIDENLKIVIGELGKEEAPLCKGRWRTKCDGGIVIPRKHNKSLVPTAKMLRKNMTKEEKHLWYDYLRKHPIRFTRQKILGKYITDFYCPKAKLVIEIDGSGHYSDEGKLYDAIRTEYLEQFDLTIIRIPNSIIHKHFRDVCNCIDHLVEQSLSQLR